jgi:hypothetical protein
MVVVSGTVVVTGGTGTVAVITVVAVSGGTVTVVAGSVSVIGTVVVDEISVFVTVRHAPR